MKSFVQEMDNLPWILKIILCLPALDIIWAVYRIIDGAAYKKLANVLLGIVWIVGACTVTWLLDLIFVILGKNVLKF